MTQPQPQPRLLPRRRQPYLAELIGPRNVPQPERRAFALASLRSQRRHERDMSAIEDGFLRECVLPDPVHRRAAALAERLLEIRVRHLREREDLIDELNKYRRRIDEEADKENIGEVIEIDSDGKEGEQAEHEKEDEEAVECCFCLDDMQDGESICRLPCMHVFHADCVVPYLLSTQALMCPMCRHPVQPDTVHLLPTFKWGSQ